MGQPPEATEARGDAGAMAIAALTASTPASTPSPSAADSGAEAAPDSSPPPPPSATLPEHHRLPRVHQRGAGSLPLRSYQIAALEEISACRERGRNVIVVGATGSGKTDIFIQAVRWEDSKDWDDG